MNFSSSKQTNSLHSQVSIIHVYTDVGVKDIDDELLIMYLSNQSCLDLTFVFMGSDGVSPSEALAHWIREYEPTVLKKTSGLIDNKISYMTIAEYKEYDAVACDYALQISPMNGYTGENLTVHKKYIFAGDYETPEGSRDSFNKQGAQDILDRFQSQDKLIDIPSEHMAKMRFNKSLFSKFSGNFHDNIVFTAFMLAFGRMSPTHPANKFAEGLINPNAGRGANYCSVMKMKEKLSITIDLRPPAVYSAAVEYCNDLEANGVVLKDRDGTIKHLTEINDVLQVIYKRSAGSSNFSWGLFGFSEEPSKVFVSDFDIDSIPDILIPSWEYFKKNSSMLIDSFNPVYDLFSGYVLNGIINGENRVNHTPEEFLQNIVEEF